MKEQKILEILLGTILIILLIIMIFLFNSPKNNSTPPTNIINSFNKNYYSTSNTIKEYEKDYKTNYIDYEVYAHEETIQGLLGNKIDKYLIRIKNTDDVGGYFKIKFYFTDYYGKENIEVVSYYISPHENKEFIYKNVYAEKYKFRNWDYEVLAKTKIHNTYS